MLLCVYFCESKFKGKPQLQSEMTCKGVISSPTNTVPPWASRIPVSVTASASVSIMLVDLAGREQERLSMCRTERFKDHLVGALFVLQVPKTGIGSCSKWVDLKESLQ